MTVRRFVVDAGGVSRLVRRRFVVDAGGVSRAVKRRFVVDAGGVARLTYSANYGTAVLGVGTDGVSQFGYNAAFFGTLTPATYTDGSATVRTVSLLVWDGASVLLWINGAGVPDTDATFSALGLDATTLLRSAATYNPAAGGGTRSQWSWVSAFLHGGANVAVEYRS